MQRSEGTGPSSVSSQARSLWSLVSSWAGGTGALPTTSAGAELGIVLTFLGVRATDVVQLIVSMSVGLRRATAPILDGTLISLCVVESVVLAVVFGRARRLGGAMWVSIDVAVSAVFLLAMPFYSAEADRVGTWTAWGLGLSLSAASGAGLGYARRWQTFAATTLLAGCYLISSLPGAANSGVTSTVIANTVSFFGFALATRAVGGYMRRLAATADQARIAAAESGRLAEFGRHRLLLHDQASVLGWLAGPALTPELDKILRQQAATGAVRIRTFLAQPNAPIDAGDGTGSLVAVVRASAAEFSDLPIELVLDLAAAVKIAPAGAHALGGAVVTLLHNIRLHAAAHLVVVHADVDSPAGEWELTIRDDGVGFNSATVRRGFGLRVQVEQALAEQGISSDVQSIPGRGTFAVLRGPFG
jgi:hypothetical protein